MIVRPAQPADRDDVAELLYATSPSLWQRLAGSRDRALATLRTAFERDGLDASAEVVDVAVLDGAIAGVCASFPVVEARRRGDALARLALSRTRLRDWPATLLFFYRAHRAAPPPPPRCLYIDALATAERFRRRGVARALLAHAERSAASQGLRRLGLETEADNERARSLYESTGFEAVAESRPAHGFPGFVAYQKAVLPPIPR